LTALKGQRVLAVTFFLTLAFCVLEFVGGKLSRSLALLADAGHMLTDLGALGLAFFTGWVSAKRPTPKMSYGFYRMEVLSALINGTALITLAVFIVKEAFDRLKTPPEINTTLMLLVAFAGFAFDLINGFLIKRFAHENINIRGAFFHIVSDALGSFGTIVAGGVIRFTGWRYADPVVSCFIAFLIVVSACRLLKDVGEVLLEATPSHIDLEALENRILSLEGIQAIHDLHVWSLSPGKEALSAHLEVVDDIDRDQILHKVNEILSKHFQIDHTTLQVETPAQKRKEKSHFHE
jgi:cobalt-zinc-cadmium efflux system protein